MKEDEAVQIVRNKRNYPYSVFIIAANEFCERVAYFGIRTVLVLYFTQKLLFTDYTATFIFHVLSMLAYFTPFLGGILADSWLGKFKTIGIVLFVYCVGNILLCYGSYPQSLGDMRILSSVGLIMITVASGGIKACGASFGADQFIEGQERLQSKFFAILYIATNFGSLVGTFLIPILKDNIYCFGEKNCYSVGFLIPTIIMILSLCIFLVGKKFYTVKPPEGNVLVKVLKCIWYALGKKFKTNQMQYHFLDNAADIYDRDFLLHTKILLHALILYLPLPLFWAVVDQQASNWTLQANKMNGKVGSFHITAEHMQCLTPLFIILLVPIFENILYPAFEKRKLFIKPMQRIVTGGLFAAIAFILAGFIEMILEGRIMPNDSKMIIVNNSPCKVKIEGADLETIKAFGIVSDEHIAEKELTWLFKAFDCDEVVKPYKLSFTESSEIQSIMVTVVNGKLVAIQDNKTISRDHDASVRIFYNMMGRQNVTFFIQNINGQKLFFESGKTEAVGMSQYLKLPPGTYDILVAYNETTAESFIASGKFHSGGIYFLTFYDREQGEKSSGKYVFNDGYSIFLQVPQYLFLALGEIMFSISAQQFAYSQTTLSMQSTIRTLWFLPMAAGNILVLLVTKLKLFYKSIEMFIYALLITLCVIILPNMQYNEHYKFNSLRENEREKEREREGDIIEEDGDEVPIDINNEISELDSEV